MVDRLERRQHEQDLHFITFSCAGRRPYLGEPAARSLFEMALEKTRSSCHLEVIGYVVMPEHVHLLLSEPPKGTLALAVAGLKLFVTRRSKHKPFWLPRYYDFNVCTEAKRVEKLNYMHNNPVKRGLVERPEQWAWSSGHYYQTFQPGRVTIDSSWMRVAANKGKPLHSMG